MTINQPFVDNPICDTPYTGKENNLPRSSSFTDENDDDPLLPLPNFVNPAI